MNLIQGAIGHPDWGVIYGLQPKPHTCTAKLSGLQGLRKDTDARCFPLYLVVNQLHSPQQKENTHNENKLRLPSGDPRLRVTKVTKTKQPKEQMDIPIRGLKA